MSLWSKTAPAHPAVLLALGCFVVCQWVFLSTINHCSIFNPKRPAEVSEFRHLSKALVDEVLTVCGSGATRRVLFSDSDVAMPYIMNQLTSLRGCTVMRETVVTPFQPEELSDCSSVYLVEHHLPRTGIPPPPAPAGMRRLRTWESASGGFGFSTFQGARCSGGAEL